MELTNTVTIQATRNISIVFFIKVVKSLKEKSVEKGGGTWAIKMMTRKD